MIRAVLFDLGDTLLDFEPVDSRALFRRGATKTYEYLQRKGCKLPPFENYCRRQLRAIRWAYFWAKLTRREFNSLTLLRRLAGDIHVQDNENILMRLAWLWYSPLIEHTSIEPELVSTLALLQARGIKLGIVSNTFVPGEVLDRHLRLTGLLEFFPTRIYSSEVGFRKPDRRIFELASKSLRVEPAQTLFVGDIVKTDILGARACGMRTAIKQPWCSPTARHRIADHVVRRIADVLEIVFNGAPQEQHALFELKLPA
jgi:HAD superfamily hydrolase (TIGR01549 family)